MNGLFDIYVSLRGGVHDLAKALGVLALMDLTPRTLICEQKGERLEIHIRLSAPAPLVEVLASRLRNLIQIAAMTVAEIDPCSGASA